MIEVRDHKLVRNFNLIDGAGRDAAIQGIKVPSMPLRSTNGTEEIVINIIFAVPVAPV